jgi:hypothetical protein
MMRLLIQRGELESEFEKNPLGYLCCCPCVRILSLDEFARFVI